MDRVRMTDLRPRARSPWASSALRWSGTFLWWQTACGTTQSTSWWVISLWGVFVFAVVLSIITVHKGQGPITHTHSPTHRRTDTATHAHTHTHWTKALVSSGCLHKRESFFDAEDVHHGHAHACVHKRADTKHTLQLRNAYPEKSLLWQKQVRWAQAARYHQGFAYTISSSLHIPTFSYDCSSVNSASSFSSLLRLLQCPHCWVQEEAYKPLVGQPFCLLR